MRDAADICDQKQDAYDAMSRGPEDHWLDLLARLAADDRKFVRCWRDAVDSYTCICNYCGVSYHDEYQIPHKPTCPVAQARSVLDSERLNWKERLQLEFTYQAYCGTKKAAPAALPPS